MQDRERLNQLLRTPLQPQFIKNKLAKIGVQGDTDAAITDVVSVGDNVMAILKTELPVYPARN